jgi:hypothetical protein
LLEIKFDSIYRRMHLKFTMPFFESAKADRIEYAAL